MEKKFYFEKFEEIINFTSNWYFKLSGSIWAKNIDLFLEAVNNINEKERERPPYFHLLTTGALGDLTREELEIYYKFGFPYISDLIVRFDNKCESNKDSYADKELNEKFYSAWYNNIKPSDMLFQSTKYNDPNQFLKGMAESLRERLLIFQSNFGKIHSISRKTPTKEPNYLLKLSDIFKAKKLYDEIIKKLSVDYIGSKTKIWKDQKGGSLRLLASLIKYFHTKGFYKDNYKPSNEEIKIIARNTFGIELSIDTVKKAKINLFENNSGLKFFTSL